MELPWLEQPLKNFCSHKLQGQLAHGYLVGINRGEGGHLLVDKLAQAALCTDSRSFENGCCEQCKSCQLIQAGNHPDLHLIEADGNQIKIDQVRQLCDSLTKTAQQGGQRVAIIYNCEKLNLAASNALLKTLEEPGGNTLLLLQSDTPTRLLPTITSRCQKLFYTSPTIAQIKSWLEQQFSLTEDPTWCLSIMGGALELAQAIESERYQNIVNLRKLWIQSLSSGHLCASLINIDEKQTHDAIKVLYLLLRYKLIKQQKLDALQRAEIVNFSHEIMMTFHRLMTMPTVNYGALFQHFLSQYNRITRPL